MQLILPIALLGTAASASLLDVLAARQTNNAEEAYCTSRFRSIVLLTYTPI